MTKRVVKPKTHEKAAKIEKVKIDEQVEPVQEMIKGENDNAFWLDANRHYFQILKEQGKWDEALKVLDEIHELEKAGEK